jgi:hypothetical protein
MRHKRRHAWTRMHKKTPLSIRVTGIYRYSKPPSLSRKYVMPFTVSVDKVAFLYPK